MGAAMTAQEIADRLAAGPRTVERVKKAEALCQRSNVALADMLAALPSAIRAELENTP